MKRKQIFYSVENMMKQVFQIFIITGLNMVIFYNLLKWKRNTFFSYYITPASGLVETSSNTFTFSSCFQSKIAHFYSSFLTP